MRRLVAFAAVLFVAGAFLFSASGAFAQACLSQGSNSASGSGWLAGARAGYNWQQDAFVYGLAADLSGTGLKSSMSGGLTVSCPTADASTSAKVDWYGTFRARLGWTSGQFLFYGTGGLAFGDVELNSSFTSAGLSLNSQASSVRAGWVAGGGIEYLLQPNLVLGLGYQYVDLGTVSLADSITSGNILVSQTASARAAFHVVAVSLSLRFPPMPAKPWEGFYAGGQVGGAWGLNTNADYSTQIIVLSDVRLKRDVALVGRLDDGLGLYRYRYLWSDTVYVGVMAQEVALIHPEAIVRDALDDYLRVDYGRLGLKLMTLPEWNVRNKSERL
jgi:outer membrane immunogenic protein